MLIGIAIFIVGSIACALAPNMLVLILARGLQGLGGGGLIALAQTIMADIVPPRERGRYQVYFASVFMTSSLLGPVLGGFFAEHLHWSVIFWINIRSACWRFVIAYRGPEEAARATIGRTGSTFSARSAGGGHRVASAGAELGRHPFPWASAPMLGLLAALGLLWGLVRLRACALAPEPLIPPAFCTIRSCAWAVLSACFGMGTYIGLTIYLPVYFETVRGLSASHSGLALIPLMAGTVVGANLSGPLHGEDHSITSALPIAGLLVRHGTGVLVAAWRIAFRSWRSKSFWLSSASASGPCCR